MYYLQLPKMNQQTIQKAHPQTTQHKTQASQVPKLDENRMIYDESVKFKQ